MIKMFSRLETPFQSICRGKDRDAFSPALPFFSVDVSYEQFQMHSEGIMPPLLMSSFSLQFLGFWVHCNDSKLNVCSVEEVCKTQAYILFYTQRTVQDKARISEKQLQAQVPSKNSDKDRRLTFP